MVGVFAFSFIWIMGIIGLK